MALNSQQFLEKLELINLAGEQFIAASPQWVQYWVYWMMAIILSSFVLAIWKKEARVIALASVYSVVLSLLINMATDGPTQLWGLAHILPWTPVVIWLAFYRFKHIIFSTWYGRWVLAAFTTMTISLVFDFYDVYRYFTS